MARALGLARRRTGWTYPNPCVGAVLVKRGRVLAAASSGKTGEGHAEVRALGKAGDARGATLFVTLEPCAHQGRTPPCVRAIREAGVAAVVVAIRDPARHVDGKGIAALRRAGIDVRVGVLADEARKVHRHYLHHVETGRPWVSLKAAVSLDGQLAVSNGESKWITGEAARRDGHRLRARHHAIAVGARTVALDDPRLDVRMVRGVDPTPVIFDSRLSLAVRPRASRPQLLREGTLVLHTARASPRARASLARSGAEGIEVAADAGGRVSILAALEALGSRSIRSLLVEGGGALHGSFVQSELWQRMHLSREPCFLGEGRALLAGVSWERVKDAPRVRVLSRRRLGDDLASVLEPY
jgi:diaminohydroxyphosphoribosylaminopyrimidine deaminase/5-amino-6-(5-phosphoribosylamino)uracil reductase